MIIPNVEHKPGTQSLKVIRTGTGSYGPGSGKGTAWDEAIVASRKNHHPRANCVAEQVSTRAWAERERVRVQLVSFRRGLA